MLVYIVYVGEQDEPQAQTAAFSSAEKANKYAWAFLGYGRRVRLSVLALDEHAKEDAS